MPTPQRVSEIPDLTSCFLVSLPLVFSQDRPWELLAKNFRCLHASHWLHHSPFIVHFTSHGHMIPIQPPFCACIAGTECPPKITCSSQISLSLSLLTWHENWDCACSVCVSLVYCIGTLPIPLITDCAYHRLRRFLTHSGFVRFYLSKIPTPFGFTCLSVFGFLIWAGGGILFKLWWRIRFFWVEFKSWESLGALRE